MVVCGGDGGGSKRPATNSPGIAVDSNWFNCLVEYGDLEIQHGLVAALDFGRMVAEGTPIDEKEKTREALLAYCQKDTEAMVRIFDMLYSMDV